MSLENFKIFADSVKGVLESQGDSKDKEFALGMLERIYKESTGAVVPVKATKKGKSRGKRGSVILAVRTALSEGPRQLSEVISVTGKPRASVLSALTSLTKNGTVVHQDGLYQHVA
jgi:hypothetical protein